MRILVANRGEIALRVIRAIKELGHESVAIYSQVDKDAMHVKAADIAVCVGKADARDSYLNIPNILSVATSFGVDAIHPGYGFLSEQADFAKLCEQLKIEFIGPSADVIDLMGDKINAILEMQKANVPTVAIDVKPIANAQLAHKLVETMTLPVIIKAAGGGGGKGLRIVHTLENVIDAYNQVYSEAKITDPNPRIFIEHFIEDAKHIEVQIMADKHSNVVHVGTRDCSMQRNNQKVIEEAPGQINAELLSKIENAAVRAAKAINYENAGTVEFLVKGSQFYFLEMNTRIQVEHPVSEMISGLDLVKLQIKVASGEELGLEQSDIKFSGHAIECRINAEDPMFNFSPTPGQISGLNLPSGLNVRNEFGVTTNDFVQPFYDSMIGKIICYGQTREEAIIKMKIALKEFHVEQIKTIKPFLMQLLEEEEFIDNSYCTTFIKENYDEILAKIREKDVE